MLVICRQKGMVGLSYWGEGQNSLLKGLSVPKGQSRAGPSEVTVFWYSFGVG